MDIKLKIPKSDWWCGCFPDIKFKSEEQYVKHMMGKIHSYKLYDFQYHGKAKISIS